MTDHAPPTTAAGYRILRAARIPDRPGAMRAFIVLCRLPHNRITRFVTWQMNEADRSTYWGHYEARLQDAQGDFAKRVKAKGATEVQVGEPASHRPGDMAAIYAEENGIPYSEALVACNMD